MIRLSRAAKGTAYGDVSNASVRNILSEISKRFVNGGFTVEDMEETMEYFDWKCPYTGIDLRDSKEREIDHICPQNKEFCGLNLKGNLVYVHKSANSKKSNLDVEDFLLHNKDVIKDIDVLGRTRQDRIDNIRAFQKKFGYDPDKIKKIVSPLVMKQYDDIRKVQESMIEEDLKELEANGFKIIESNKTSTAVRSSTNKWQTELVFYPNDEKDFTNEFLKKQNAQIVLTYDSGIIKTYSWKCSRFDENSSLRSNIQSRPFWRKRKDEGLIKVEVKID